MLTRRWLPKAEWPEKLAGTELGATYTHFGFKQLRVVVVEDESGRMVACWGVVRYLHLEGIWKRPDVTFAENRQAWKLLFDAANEAAGEFGDSLMMTGAVTEQVREMIGRLNGKLVKADQYLLPVPLRIVGKG